MTIVFYVSGHGFGHASRSIEVINALANLDPDLTIVVRSQVAPWLFARTARPGVRLEPVETDTGVVQIDSLHPDEAATLLAARAFMRGLPARARAESARLRELGASLVVSDIPALGIAAAAGAGLPAIALGNFTWDWIYAGYEGGQDVAEAVGREYTRTTLALRLPMWGGFATMPDVRDLPFVARRSTKDPDDVREAFGFPRREPLALVSFGGYGLDTLDLDALGTLEGYRVIVGRGVPRTGRALIPFDEGAMYAQGFRYEDLVRAVDVVVSKPGYGIIAECIANDTALLYTSRGHFVEYDVLVAAMPRFLRCGFIDHADLFSGRWTPHLDAVVSQPAPAEQPAVNGAEVAAEILWNMAKD